MGEINSSRLLDAVSSAVGPAPWHWKTFPSFTSSTGRRFVWTHHGEQGALAHLVTLNLENAGDQPRLALNTYCRPFLVPPSRLGIWCPEGQNIRLLCFSPDEMSPFDLSEVAGWFKQSSERIYAATPPICDCEISTQLPAGVNEIKIPEELQTVDELMVTTSRATRNLDDPAFALYVFYPHAGLVEVLPQKWYTALSMTWAISG